MVNDEYLKTAVDTAKASGKIFQRYFGKPKNVSIKNGDPKNFVTEVDQKIEKQIRKLLQKKFPTHKIIGEELGSHKLEKNDYIWIIDPIDGTVNFIHGLPLCCISIALWDSHGPLIAVVFSPALNLLFTAQRGKGANLNGRKIKVSDKKYFGGFGWGRNPIQAAKNFPKIIKHLPKIRALGSSALEFAFVAAGIFDFHIQAGINIWDFAASVLLIQEAGGKVSDWKGKPLTLNSTHIAGGNKLTHPNLVKILKGL